MYILIFRSIRWPDSCPEKGTSGQVRTANISITLSSNTFWYASLFFSHKYHKCTDLKESKQWTAKLLKRLQRGAGSSRSSMFAVAWVEGPFCRNLAHKWEFLSDVLSWPRPRKCVFRHMWTANAMFRLRIRAVWSGPSLSVNRIAGHNKKYQWRANVRIRLCACVGWI